MEGVVSSFIGCLGAGYIIGTDGCKYFVQDSDFVDRRAEPGQAVMFTPSTGNGRRFRAKEVKILEH